MDLWLIIQFLVLERVAMAEDAGTHNPTPKKDSTLFESEYSMTRKYTEPHGLIKNKKCHIVKKQCLLDTPRSETKL